MNRFDTYDFLIPIAGIILLSVLILGIIGFIEMSVEADERSMSRCIDLVELNPEELQPMLKEAMEDDFLSMFEATTIIDTATNLVDGSTKRNLYKDLKKAANE